MKQNLYAVVGGLTAAMVMALSACGSATQASASLDTIQALDTPNYGTIAPVTNPATTAPAAEPEAGSTTSAETIHKVKAGQSLAVIANLYKVDLEELRVLNNFDSTNPLIHPNQEIKIPAGATLPESSSSGEATSEDNDTIGNAGSGAEGDGEQETDSAGGCTYTIKAGDNPSKVAGKVGISTDELVKANPSSVINTFLVGAELIIPPPGKC